MEEIVRMLAIPPRYAVVELYRTSDGFVLGRQAGDCGANLFLGSPSFRPGAGQDWRRKVWGEWTFGERRRAAKQAKWLGWTVREMLGA